jgi:hypothetical protein
MTEDEWLACGLPSPMLTFLHNGVAGSDSGTLSPGPSALITSRKCQLFASCCIRRFGYLSRDADCISVATWCERLADSKLTTDGFKAAYGAFSARMQNQDSANRSNDARSISYFLFPPVDAHGAEWMASDIASMLAWSMAGESVKQTCADADEEDKWLWGFSGGPPRWKVASNAHYGK